ncbi:MAG: anti-sigma factor [Streptosporangiaceae bacterium]
MTTFDEQNLHTLAGAYVLDAITDDERSRFAAHLADCAGCRDEVNELREASARLGMAHAERPRPELKERAIRAAHNTGQLAPVLAENARRPRAGRRTGPGTARRLPVLLAAAAAAVVVAAAIGIGTHYADMQGQHSQPGTGTVDTVLRAPDAVMRTAPVSSGGMAIVVTSRREHMAVFIAHGLSALPHAMRYELWLMGPRGERPAGMLAVQRKDMAGPALITGMASGDMVGLTVEPASGSLHPTSAPLVLIGSGRH